MVIVTRTQIARNHCETGTRLWDKYMKGRKQAPLRLLLTKAAKIKGADRNTALYYLARYGKAKQSDLISAVYNLAFSNRSKANDLREIIRMLRWREINKSTFATLAGRISPTTLVDTLAPKPMTWVVSETF